jgi:serine/threonine protein kinase
MNKLSNYKYIKRLGHGSFGTVNLYKHNKTNKEVAIKFIDMNRMYKKSSSKTRKQILRDLFNEIHILQSIKRSNNKNVLKYIDYGFIDNKTNLEIEDITNHHLLDITIFIITEYICCKTLYDVINSNILYEKYVKNPLYFLHIIKGLYNGLKYLHKNNIVHYDLKLDNIMIREQKDRYDDPIIVDYGIGCIQDICIRILGTINYMPYEQLQAYENDTIMLNRVGKKSDIFSLGIVLYIMINDKLPYHDILYNKNISEDTRNIKLLKRFEYIDYIQKYKENRLKKVKSVNKMVSLPIYKTDYKYGNYKFNKDINNLIDSMLIIDYKYRPDINKISKILSKINYPQHKTSNK